MARGVNGGSDVLFPGRYGQIVEVQSDGLEVRLRQAVAGIDHSGAHVVATTASGGSGWSSRRSPKTPTSTPEVPALSAVEEGACRAAGASYLR